MLLFGFPVLAVLLCGDVFSGAIAGTSDADREQENGIHSNYCQKSRDNSYSWFTLTLGRPNYPPTPIECCTGSEMRCKNYINPGETKFGLWNGDSWPMRECACEHKLRDCLRKNMTPDDQERAEAMLYQETCFKATGCEDKSTLDCTPKYKAISVHTSYLEKRSKLDIKFYKGLLSLG